MPGFVDNWDQFSCEERRKYQPFRFDRGEVVQEKDCPLRNTDKRGNYVCGRYLPSWDSGENGRCTIDNFDVPEGIGCPYEEN